MHLRLHLPTLPLYRLLFHWHLTIAPRCVLGSSLMIVLKIAQVLNLVYGVYLFLGIGHNHLVRIVQLINVSHLVLWLWLWPHVHWSLWHKNANLFIRILYFPIPFCPQILIRWTFAWTVPAEHLKSRCHLILDTLIVHIVKHIRFLGGIYRFNVVLMMGEMLKNGIKLFVQIEIAFPLALRLFSMVHVLFWTLQV